MQINIQEEIPCSRVKSLCFHRDRPVILLALHNGEIRAYDYSLSTFISTFLDHEGPVRSIDFHSTTDLFISGGDDQKVRIWDYHTKTCHALTGHTDYIRCVKFHPYEPFLLSTSDDRTLKIWNFQSKKKVKTLAGHTNYVMAAQFLTGHRIVSVSLDQTMRVWNMDDGTSEIIEAHDKGINALAILYKNDNLKENDSKNISVFSSGNSTPFSSGNSSVFSSTHKDFLICSASDDKTIKMFDGDLLHRDTFTYHTRAVTALTCLLSCIVSVGEDGNIFINKRKVIKRIERDGRFWCVSHNHRGMIAAGGDNCFLLFTLKQPILFDASYYLKDNHLLSYQNEPVLDLRKEVVSFYGIDTHLIVNYQHKFEVYQKINSKGNSSVRTSEHLKGVSSGGIGSKGVNSRRISLDNMGIGSKGISSENMGIGSKGISSDNMGIGSKGIGLKKHVINQKGAHLKSMNQQGAAIFRKDGHRLTLLWSEMGHATFFNQTVISVTNQEFNSFTLDGRILEETLFQQECKGLKGTDTHLFVYHARKLTIFDTQLNRHTITVPFNIKNVEQQNELLVIVGKNDMVLLSNGRRSGNMARYDNFGVKDDCMRNLGKLRLNENISDIKENSGTPPDIPNHTWFILRHLSEMPRITSLILHNGIVFYTTEKQFKYFFQMGEGVICSLDQEVVVALVRGEIDEESIGCNVNGSTYCKGNSSTCCKGNSSQHYKGNSSECCKGDSSQHHKGNGSTCCKGDSSHHHKGDSSQHHKRNGPQHHKGSGSIDPGSIQDNALFVFLFITANHQLVHREVSLSDLLFKQAVLSNNQPLIRSFCEKLPGMCLVQYLKQYGQAGIALPYIEDRREKLMLHLAMGDYQGAAGLIRSHEEHHMLVDHMIKQINRGSTRNHHGLITGVDNNDPSSNNTSMGNKALVDALQPYFPILLQSLSHCPNPLHFLFLFCTKQFDEIKQAGWTEKNCQLYQGMIKSDRNVVYQILHDGHPLQPADSNELSDFSTEEDEKLMGGQCIDSVLHMDGSKGISSIDLKGNSLSDLKGVSSINSTGNSSADLKGIGSLDLKGVSSTDSKGNSSADLKGISSINSTGSSSAGTSINAATHNPELLKHNTENASTYNPELLKQKLSVYGTDTPIDDFMNNLLPVLSLFDQNKVKEFRHSLLSLLYTGADRLPESARYLLGAYLAAIFSERRRKKETEGGCIIDRARFFYGLKLLNRHRRMQAETYVAVSYKNGNYDTARRVARQFIEWTKTMPGHNSLSGSNQYGSSTCADLLKHDNSLSGSNTPGSDKFASIFLSDEVPHFTDADLRQFHRILSTHKKGDRYTIQPGHFCSDTGRYREEYFKCMFCGNGNEERECGICGVGHMSNEKWE